LCEGDFATVNPERPQRTSLPWHCQFLNPKEAICRDDAARDDVVGRKGRDWAGGVSLTFRRFNAHSFLAFGVPQT